MCASVREFRFRQTLKLRPYYRFANAKRTVVTERVTPPPNHIGFAEDLKPTLARVSAFDKPTLAYHFESNVILEQPIWTTVNTGSMHA